MKSISADRRRWTIDRTLFEHLYRQYYKPLFLYAYSLSHSKADAEDLTANTFVKALTTFQSGNIQAWLYTVLRNEFLDFQKKKKRAVNFSDKMADMIPSQVDVWENYLRNKQLQWLYSQISQLPGLEQDVMLLTVQTDYKDLKIAEILGITPDHVRVLRYRAKTRMLNASKEE